MRRGNTAIAVEPTVSALVLDRPRLSKVGGAAALLVAALLVLGPVGMLAGQPGLGVRNWLVVLFQMNSGVGSLPTDPLRVFNAVDLLVLGAAAVTFWAITGLLAQGNRFWREVCVVLPLAGVALVLVTHLAGRCALMAALLVLGFLLLRAGISRGQALLGIVASALLLVGDFGTTGGHVPVVATLIAMGYVLAFVWFALAGAGQPNATQLRSRRDRLAPLFCTWLVQQPPSPQW